MILKFALAGALALASVPANAATIFVANPYIQKVSCSLGSGSAFRLDTGQWVSANHVTSLGKCSVNGAPITVTYADPIKDYSLFTLAGDSIKAGGLKLDCSGFKSKQWYYGIGAALGNPVLTATPVMAQHIDGWDHPRAWSALFYNRFTPGQSGGAVVNAWSGSVSGIVNAYAIYVPASFSLALKDTVLCL